MTEPNKNQLIPTEKSVSGKKQILGEAFWATFRSAFYVFKKLHIYFAFYYIPFALVALFLAYRFLFPPDLERERGLFALLLSYLGIAFAVFITPYYTRQYNEKSSKPSFWDFVRENVTPLVINHIKALLVILLYAIPVLLGALLFILVVGTQWWSEAPASLFQKTGDLTIRAKLGLIIYFTPLLIPVFVKIVRLMFVTQTTFFDSRCREQSLSALRASEELTKGLFWFLVCVFVFVYLSVGLFKALLEGGFGELSGHSSFFMGSSRFLLHFYMYNLTLIFWVQLYFCLKKMKFS